MEPIQVIMILFAIFAYSRAILRYKDKKISNGEFFFWTIIWVSVIFLAIIPEIMKWFSELFGIGRPIDFVVYAGIIVLFYLLFRVYVKIDSIERNITKIVRETAIGKKKK